MGKLTPEEFQEKHARRLKGSIDDMRQGIEKVTESPTLKAAAKKSKMKQNLIAALDSGKWEAGLKRVSLDDWKTKMIDKGLNRVAAGIDGAKDKVVAFAGELLPFQDKIQDELKKMPDLTLEDSIARMTHQVRRMNGFKRSR